MNITCNGLVKRKYHSGYKWTRANGKYIKVNDLEEFDFIKRYFPDV
jgi:hypothetical protein